MGLFDNESDDRYKSPLGLNNDDNNNNNKNTSWIDYSTKDYLFSLGIDANRLENPDFLREVLKEQEYRNQMNSMRNNMFGNSQNNDPFNNNPFNNNSFDNPFGL